LDVMNPSNIQSLEIAAKAARSFFIEELKADNASHVAYGATIISRKQWALWLAMATARVVEMAPALALVDILNAVFATDLGNISQLTKALVEEKVLFVATAANEAGSLADRLAKRVAAANPPAAPTPPPAG
jgi:hypothetical protein